MNIKQLFIILIILGVLIGGFFVLNTYIYNEKQVEVVLDYKDAEYVVDGQRVKLENGVAETEGAPDSVSKTITRYFGNEFIYDLNEDGREDVVFLLTQETGGSGTFYYVVASLNTEEGYIGSDAYFLGDRIAPQTIELSQNPIHKGVIVVNYVERAPGEPMSEQPSFGKSVWLKLDSGAMQFGVVEQNFEGEADPFFMSLMTRDWVWISALYNDGRIVEPNSPGSFVLSLSEDGNFSAMTDCNRMSGGYTADQSSIIFGQIAMTKMFCEGSQESEFLQILEGAVGYHFTSRGELIIDLKFDSGTATFR